MPVSFAVQAYFFYSAGNAQHFSPELLVFGKISLFLEQSEHKSFLKKRGKHVIFPDVLK